MENLSTFIDVILISVFMIVLVATILEIAMLAIEPIVSAIGSKIGMNGYLVLIVSLIFGVALCFILDIDIFAMIFEEESYPLTTFLTGLIVGRGGSWLLDYINSRDFILKLGEKKKEEKENKEKKEN